jgi:hypothetical protein
MDKAAVIERYRTLLNELNEPAHSVVLSSSSALVLLGVRMTTEELDADVPEGVFKMFERSGRFPVLEAAEGDSKHLKFDADVELNVLDTDRGVVCLGGVWSYSPSELLAQKRYLSKFPERSEGKRAADLLDIVALETLIKERSLTARALA